MSQYTPQLRFVLGGLDDVIKAKDNLTFFAQNLSIKTDYTVVLRKDLAHQIPVDVFENETKIFFESLK